MKLIPRATEKAYTEESKHVYVFFAPKTASKQAIAAAVAQEFHVTVKDVRTLTRKGKKTRFNRGKHAYPGIAFREDHKLAYVTVGENDKIPVFQDDKDAKATKKTAKNDTKDSAEQKSEKGAK